MNNLSLYELSQDYRQALETLTDPENDLPAEVIADTLEGLQGTLEDKAIENRVASMKIYLKESMESCGISKIESPWFALSIAKNPAAVDVFDEAAVPAEYKEEIVTVKINKTGIKRAIESGAEVPGAVLTRGTRLAIR